MAALACGGGFFRPGGTGSCLTLGGAALVEGARTSLASTGLKQPCAAKNNCCFARLEFERRKKLAEDRVRAIEAEKQERLRRLHWMRCPKCGAELVEVEFRGVRIDKCTSCAGLWRDSGELEQVTAKGDFLGSLLSIFGRR